MAKKLTARLPELEVSALRAHLDEAIADPEYAVVVNYPVEDVLKVAKFYKMDISNVEVHSLPNVPAVRVMSFKKALDKFKETA